MSTDANYLQLALRLAGRYRGFCAPNPPVGAVVINDRGQVLGEGVHRGCGHAHAEVLALQQAGSDAKRATLYVTLEPCHHQGRTPPCTTAIVRSGIRRVVYGLTDPNPHVRGRGAYYLRKKGIQCQHRVLLDIQRFYRSYCHWLQTGFPWLTLKLALSRDAKIAGVHGQPVVISQPQQGCVTHYGRLRSDAILTSAPTIMRDNPRLNVRLGGRSFSKPVYVLDSRTCPFVPYLENGTPLHVLDTANPLVLMHTSKCENDIDFRKRQTLLEARGVCRQRIINSSQGEGGIDIQQSLAFLGKAGYHDIWVEAGARLFRYLLNNRLVNTLILYISKQTLGGQALGLGDNLLTVIDDNDQCEWYYSTGDVVLRVTKQSRRVIGSMLCIQD